MAESSKVLHVSNVGHEISENDLLQLFQPFGVITKLVMLRAKNQALIQMQDGSSAITALSYKCATNHQIFGIYTLTHSDEPTTEDVMKPGNKMVAVGYCMYGSSCMLVLSTGIGIHRFTLDPLLGEFILIHPDIKVCREMQVSLRWFSCKVSEICQKYGC